MSGVLKQLLAVAARQPADAIALSDSHSQVTWRQLPERIQECAEQLRSRGSARIALCAENSVDWAIVDLAAQHAAIVIVPLPEFFTAAQAQHALVTAGIEWLIFDRLPSDWPAALTPTARPAQPLAASGRLQIQQLPAKSASQLPPDCQKITFTSGSTGEPKGVCLSAAQQWQVASSLAATIGLQHPRHLCLIPLATLLENVAGIYTPLLCGGEVHFATAAQRGLRGSSGVDVAALLGAIGQHQPQTLIVTPQLLTVLTTAAKQGWTPPLSLRFIAVGGARTAPELLADAAALGLPVYEGYGLSECGSVVALNSLQQSRPGTAGKILPHCQVSVVDGELIIHSPRFLGYVGDPSSWASECVHSGDLVTLDEQGYITIHGRRKNLLITSYGRNVSPEWVESLLLGSHLLRRCVVVGDGQPQLTALIDDNPAHTPERLQSWFDHCNHQLPDYARATEWIALSEQQWQPLLTANGRPRRHLIEQFFSTLTSTQ